MEAVEHAPLPVEWLSGVTVPEVEAIAGTLTNPWSISAEAARIVARIAIIHGASRVLEFGAGMSSRVLASALGATGGGMLTSIEENPTWCIEAWRCAEATGGVDAQLVRGRVRLKIDRRGIYYGYGDIPEIAARGPYDFLFVDAPWGGYGREGPVYSAIGNLVPGALIVLDDARRPREQRCLRRWLLNYPQLVLLANDLSVARGIAVLGYSGSSKAKGAVPGSLAEVWAGSAYDTVRSALRIRRHRSRQSALEAVG